MDVSAAGHSDVTVSSAAAGSDGNASSAEGLFLLLLVLLLLLLRRHALPLWKLSSKNYFKISGCGLGNVKPKDVAKM